MENKIIARQIIDFQKTILDNTFNSLAIFQQQAEQMVENILNQSAWLPEERKKAVKDWLSIYDKGCLDCKAAADSSYKKVEEFFAAGEADNKGKTSKI